MSAATVALRPILETQLSDPSCSFSIGAFGAIAEFFRRDDEPRRVDLEESLTVSTNRGAIRVCLHEDVLPVAYETLSSRKKFWLHGFSLCLPSVAGNSNGRIGVTELGRDVDAIRPADRGDLLFDLGLGVANLDFCIRTNDVDLIKVMRRAVGTPLLGEDNGTMVKIVEANPHRVALSRLGRVEVYQAIGHERTPEGPHTHVLPKLLRSGRTHDAKIPIPGGYIPCLSVYPASPLFDKLGEPRAYDRASHLAFDALLKRWGAQDYVAQKDEISQFIRDEIDPASFKLPKNRLRRSAVRIALRQLACDDLFGPRVSRWSERFDPDH